MKKLLSFLFLSLIFIGAAPSASASISSDFVINNVPSNDSAPWKKQQFDRLVFDAVVPSKNGQIDFLESLAVMNLGSARDTKGIEKLILWTDGHAPGFQGMGIDNKIGESSWDGSSLWYWTDMDIIIPATGLRIFISAETRRSMDDNRTVQLFIPILLDNNGNGKFDIGDKGVFTYYGNNGPTDNIAQNIDTQTIRYDLSDHEGPKAAITNLFDGDKVATGENFIISGLAKDQGRTYPGSVEISIAKTGYAASWQAVSTDKVDFADWRFVWKPAEAGNYALKVRARDLDGNETVSDAITVAAGETIGKVSAAKSHLTIDVAKAKPDGKIYVNAFVEVRDANGSVLAGKTIELSYLRASDGYIARNSQASGADGAFVWGVPSKIASEITLTAIVDGVELAEHPKVTFMD